MSFPNFAGKHAHDAFFTPQDWLRYFRQENPDWNFIAPEGVIFCYQSSLLKYILENEETERISLSTSEFYLLKATEGRIGICGGFGIGAPVVSALLEELIALGCQRFLSIGTAGGLQRGLEIGQIVVCDRAVRDEGVSHHYLEPGKYSYPNPELTGRLKAELDRLGLSYREGATWTIDAIYRETVEEARQYQAEGVYTVEMEAAALLAVAQYRQVELATAFVVSDSLADLEWNPQFRAPATKDSLARLYEAARATLL